MSERENDIVVERRAAIAVVTLGRVAKANALAERVVSNVSVYVEQKVEQLQRQVEVSDAQLKNVEDRIATATRQQEAERLPPPPGVAGELLFQQAAPPQRHDARLGADVRAEQRRGG